MILIDSCGWIEFLIDGKKAETYAPYFTQNTEIFTPTIVIYEVYKKVLRECGKDMAVVVAAQMNSTRVIELTENIALEAALLGIKHQLPMADAIVYATALSLQCPVITSDQHFSGLDQVIFI